jgi:hypothetical protein
LITPAIAYTLAGLMLYSLGTTAWVVFRGIGPKRVLFIKSGRTIIPKPLKMGQKEYTWTRADKSEATYPLKDETANPYGKRGTCWIVDDANGEFLTWDASGMELPFDHNYYAQVISDKREIKWFQAQAAADKGAVGPKPILIILVLAVVGFFLFQKFGGG